MSKARPKASDTDQHARKIASAIAKGLPPPLTPGFDRYLEQSPTEIFAAFEGAARHMPPAGNDEALAFGYLFLLQAVLERVRYRIDSGSAAAADMIAAFQADVAARADAGEIDGPLFAYVGGALHQAKIPASPELVAATAKPDGTNAEDLPEDVGVALSALLGAFGSDPFELVNALAQFGHAMPEEGRCALACSLALGDDSDGRAAAIMFLLDSSAAVRRAAAGALADVAARLSPVDVRRLIAIRNWRAESERPELDTIIRKARTAGIACARWEAGSVETILATAIDGAGTQALLLISPASRKKKRISSILTKDGITDAWNGEPETARQIEAAMAAAGMDLPTLSVSRPYLDRVLSHALALTTGRGEVPPLELLKVAEMIGGADWQPAQMDFREALSGLMAELPAAMRDAASVAAVLRDSDKRVGFDTLRHGWFEDDPQVAKVVGSGYGRGRAKLATYLLQSLIARRRDKWADRFLRTALWMREAPAEAAAELGWGELTLIAEAIANGRDLTEIGLMHDIAKRTIAVLSGEVRAGT